MRTRLALTAAVAGAVALVAPSALAASGPPVLDGKKVKELKLDAAAGPQTHDESLATGFATGEDRMQCGPERCAVLPFVYKPAKGVKGDVLFSINWNTPGSDFDLYVVQIDKNGRTKVGSCGGSAGLSEKVFLSADNFKPGKTYGLLADFYRTPGEKVTGSVTMPASNTIKTTVP
ncbi:MAG: hypothetical protein ABR614_11750, partial [Mycobacteriales bacterium]